MAQSSEVFLKEVGEKITIGGKPIFADVDSISFAQYIRLGGKSAGVEMTVFVRKQDFDESGMKKGDKVIARGYQTRIKRQIDAGDGQYELTCEPFNAGGL